MNSTLTQTEDDARVLADNLPDKKATVLEISEDEMEKLAFVFGYGVYVSEDGDEPLTPRNWITDSCATFDFAADNGVRHYETDAGTTFYLPATLAADYRERDRGRSATELITDRLGAAAEQ